MRLIDADALIPQMESDANQMEDPIAIMFAYAAISDIKHAPTVDAKPVRHGHWVRKGLLFHCSACGYGAFNSDFVYGARYCPTCGARMDERSEE